MRRRHLSTLAVVHVFVGSLSCGRTSGYVEVAGAPSAKSACVILFAQAEGEEAKQTDGVRWQDRRAHFAVAPSKPTGVTIWAKGFAEDCQTPTRPAEATVETALVRGKIVQLILDVVDDAPLDGGTGGGGGGGSGGAGGSDAGVDADGDGSPAGEDCADDDPRRAPTRPEACANGIDDDCDGRSDCADDGCDGLSCDDLLACTPASTCRQGACQATAACTPTTDGGCFEYCAIDGGCAWRARIGAACDDGQRCTYGDACTAQGTCVPTMICADQDECTAEVCATDMCAQSVIRYGACGDGGACSATGRCVPSGFRAPVSNVDPDGTLSWRGRSASTSCSGTAQIDTGTGTVSVDNGCLNALALDQHTVVPQPDGGVALYVLATEGDLVIPSGVRINASGPRALVFLVRGKLTVAGRLSVSASGSNAGAGAPVCTLGQGGAVGQPSLPQGGGGGGGFGLPGGRGSWWDGGWTSAGQPEGDDTLVPLRGGCPGGTVDRSPPIRGGGGGGALQLSASGDVIIEATARLSAGGGGGATYTANMGSTENSGGSGGGSGGALLLEGQVIRLRSGSVLAANGGGGGQGRQQSTGAPGTNASDVTTAAPGGCTSSVCGKCGGNGGARSSTAFDGSDAGTASNCVSPPQTGGGGGGGGVGRIRLNATACELDGTASPSPSSATTSCR